MPIAPKRPCAQPGCRNLCDGRYCQDHALAARASDGELAWRTTKTSASSRGYGAAWRKLRIMILARDPICVRCGRMPSVVVDHLKPKARGGDDSPDNLQGLCDSCHTKKTASDRWGSDVLNRRHGNAGG